MADASDIADFEGKPLSQVLQEVERSYFCWALNKANGNRAEAARIARIAYQTFIRKLGLLELRITYHAE
ncbi:MAG: hypothetical protein BM559_07650 [Roseobacter sp. MedPE-SWchi]|nr:MAG: hypothetical protein BM559_07650 [Roseobacter sp. MedPE-SWchi]